MKPTERIKLFALGNQLAENDLDAVEDAHDIDLMRSLDDDRELQEDYYPQFTNLIRSEATSMATHYELFYCLESSMRTLIEEKLEFEKGANWWADCVPDPVQQEVLKNIKRELDSAVTQRSDRELDYTTFGQLGDIVRANWAAFADTFNSKSGFNKVMTVLNVLRGPIAHCSPLAPDEVLRLRLAMADWFRLMS